MRTIVVNWSVPAREQEQRGSWLSNMGASLRKVGSAWTAPRQAGNAASTRSGRRSRDPFVQADVAAFISAFMRTG